MRRIPSDPVMRVETGMMPGAAGGTRRASRGHAGRSHPPAVSARELYERFRVLIHESFKFLVIGGIGMVLTIALAVALHGLGEYIAITIATIVATVFSFLGNRHWTFRHRQGQGATHEGVLFFLLNGVGLLIYYGCIWISQGLLGLEGRLWYTATLVVGTGLGTLFRFWSYRKWVWTLRHQPQLAGAEFLGYPRSALAGQLPRAPIRVGSPGWAARPPGRNAARHAAPRRLPDRRSLAPLRPGAHRRT